MVLSDMGAVLRRVLILIAIACPAAGFGSASGADGVLSWDRYSYIIDGQRRFLPGGEFHPSRLPVRELWPDILLKFKRAGLATVNVYFMWNYHSDRPGRYDFDGIRDMDYFLGLCEEMGLYVLAKPGPYICGEWDAGGYAGWAIDTPGLTYDDILKGDPRHLAQVQEWFDAILPIIARHQRTESNPTGCVIGLQIYDEPSHISVEHLAELNRMVKAGGIVVPTSTQVQYGTRLGIVDWDTVMGVSRRNRKFLADRDFPLMVCELGTGAYTIWAGDWNLESKGKTYNRLREQHDARVADSRTWDQIALGATYYSYYVMYGGINWDFWAGRYMVSSYDLAAPIAESGALTEKYYAVKRVAQFVQSFESCLVRTEEDSAFCRADRDYLTSLKSLDTPGHFVFLEHKENDGGAQVNLRFALPVGNSGKKKEYAVPRLDPKALFVDSRTAKCIPVDVDLGGYRLVYTTSQVLLTRKIGGKAFLFVYDPPGTVGETCLRLPAEPKLPESSRVGIIKEEWNRRDREYTVAYRHTSPATAVVIPSGRDTIHLIATTRRDAGRVWPVDLEGTSCIVTGPYFMGEASTDGRKSVTMDLEATGETQVAVYPLDAAKAGTVVQVNGRPAALGRGPGVGSAAFTIPGPDDVRLPELTDWEYRLGCDEAAPGFDDSNWTPVDKGLISMGAYNVNTGFAWYRGEFAAASDSILVEAYDAYTVFLNGEYLGRSSGCPTSYGGVGRFEIGSKLKPGRNVIAVLLVSHGRNKVGKHAVTGDQSLTNPIGLIRVEGLEGAKWRIRRGLVGELQGFSVPGYRGEGWHPVTVDVPGTWREKGINTKGTVWYRTEFDLSIPDDHDLPLGLEVHLSEAHLSGPDGTWDPNGHNIRTVYGYIFLNGILLGRYHQEGPQRVFYLPKGILKTRGKNALAVCVWDRGLGGGLQSVRLAPFVRERISRVSIQLP